MPQDGTYGLFISQGQGKFSCGLIDKEEYKDILKNPEEFWGMSPEYEFQGEVVNGKLLLERECLTQDYFSCKDNVKKCLALLGYGLRDSKLLEQDLSFLMESHYVYKFAQLTNTVLKGTENGFKSSLTNKTYSISETDKSDDFLYKYWTFKTEDEQSSTVYVAPIKSYIIYNGKDLHNTTPVSYKELWDIWFRKQFAVWWHCLDQVHEESFAHYLEDVSEYVDPALGILFAKK